MSTGEQLARFPRVRLLEGPTRIQRLTRLEAELGHPSGVALFVKRDDLMGLGGGGNKLRKLEFLLGEALARGADTIITVGARQSNHARLTAAAAAQLGLRCELVLVRMAGRNDSAHAEGGNVLLDRLFGARIHDLSPGSDALDFAHARAKELHAAGRLASVIPTGGSTALGCLGYVACAEGILMQGQQLGQAFSRVVVANASSGTHAGLAVGFAGTSSSARVVKSFSVLADAETARSATLALARETVSLLGSRREIADEDIEISGDQLGKGYGIPTKAMVSAVSLLARTEGLLLDPVYSGKAFAGLLSDVRGGQASPGGSVLFVMTGGLPALFTQQIEL